MTLRRIGMILALTSLWTAGAFFPAPARADTYHLSQPDSMGTADPPYRDEGFTPYRAEDHAYVIWPSDPAPNPSPYSYPVIPDVKLTPGDVLPVTEKDVCTPGYAKRVRAVSNATKKAIYKAYGITHHPPGAYEIDHDISLEIGGSNSPKNLFPEPYFLVIGGRQMGAHEKDKLEDRLHALICSGKITLQQGQDAIRGDWTVAYREYIGEFPVAKPFAVRSPPPVKAGTVLIQ